MREILSDQDLNPSDKMELKRVLNLLDERVTAFLLSKSHDKDAAALAEYLQNMKIFHETFNENTISWKTKRKNLKSIRDYFQSIQNQPDVFFDFFFNFPF